MTGDMIVNLYERPLWRLTCRHDVRRLLPHDRECLFNFIRQSFPNNKDWLSDAEQACYSSKVFIAVDDKQITGFICYDTTAKGYISEVAVRKSYQGKGIGRELMYACLDAMRSDGYGYAVLGNVHDVYSVFFEKVCNAVQIPNSEPSKTIYRTCIDYIEPFGYSGIVKNRNIGKKPTYTKRYGKIVSELRSEGKSIRKVSEMLGISTRSVQNILKELKEKEEQK